MAMVLDTKGLVKLCQDKSNHNLLNLATEKSNWDSYANRDELS